MFLAVMTSSLASNSFNNLVFPFISKFSSWDELTIPLPHLASFIDNVIIFTKNTFYYHLQRLDLVLERIQSQNPHVHVEETFLATDYLGYTLTSNRIKPQH
jgi:hypothetical protein